MLRLGTSRSTQSSPLFLEWKKYIYIFLLGTNYLHVLLAVCSVVGGRGAENTLGNTSRVIYFHQVRPNKDWFFIPNHCGKPDEQKQTRVAQSELWACLCSAETHKPAEFLLLWLYHTAIFHRTYKIQPHTWSALPDDRSLVVPSAMLSLLSL